MRLGIVLTVCLVEINLSQEGSSSSLGGATLVCLSHRQCVVGLHQVIDDQLPSFVVSIFRIRQLIVLLIAQILVHHERNVLEQTLQQEMSIGAQKLHFCQALALHLIAVIGGVEQCDGTVYTRE